MSHLFTVGHSTHPIDEFVAILRAHGVTMVADIRTVPRSRHNPQFDEDALRGSLASESIAYHPIPALGGLRRTSADSINGGWKNFTFRGYADHMQTPEFAAGIDELLSLVDEHTVAIMCAEAVPWHCHRSLVGDALLVRGVGVDDIYSATSVSPHTLTGFAKVDGFALWYPPVQESV